MVNLFDIEGRVIVVTGGHGHLGAAISSHLKNQGAIVIATSRTAKPDKALELDISDESSRAAFVRYMSTEHGRVDGLVNNAYNGPTGTLDEATENDFNASVSMSTTWPFLLTRDLLPLMPEGSSVVNIASMYGMVSPDPSIYGDSGQNSPIFYGVGKAGMIHMSRYMAVHLAEKNIRVNSISPGPFPNLPEHMIAGDFHNNLNSKVPMGRVGKPIELTGSVQFLLSDAATFINGVNLPVDGGWTVW